KDETYSQHRIPEEKRGTAHEQPCETIETVIEKSRGQPRLSVDRSQKNSTERRRQSKSNDSGDDDGYGDCDRELTIKLTGETTQERYRDKHGAKNEHDSYDCSAHLLHRLDGCLIGALP